MREDVGKGERDDGKRDDGERDDDDGRDDGEEDVGLVAAEDGTRGRCPREGESVTAGVAPRRSRASRPRGSS